ncbi:MAG: DUF1501 domain-containing protein [Burkholderiaceae bacterium]|jgi:uncharacterized protein (DUF1501 family)
MRRRTLLQALLAAPLGAGSTRLWAAPAVANRFLLVFLRGGYDCANVLVPHSSSFYYESRPNIAVARPDAGNPHAALPIDSDWGLHPALGDSIYPLFQKKQVAFIPFAGTEDLSRSHFETQDSIELGQALSGSHDYRSGFLNRLVEVLHASGAPAKPMAFTDRVPIVFEGSQGIPNMALRAIGPSGVSDRQGQIISAMYRGTGLATSVHEGFDVRTEVQKSMQEEMDQASRNAITAKGFEAEARRIARLMRDEFNIGFLDVGGWDTHVGEGGATGYLAGRLGEFGRGLSAYAQAMGDRWKDTVVVVVSEFGRTFRENGDRGTDHGHGCVYWVLGGSIQGGTVPGSQVRIEERALFQNRDYPVLNEYRAVLGGLFARLFELDPQRLAHVFPGAKPRDLCLV